MGNAESFLEDFNAIENRLRALTRLGREKTFAVLVEAAAEKNSVIRRFRDDLKEFGDLRNAIVHERGGGQVIAEPNDWAAGRIKAIAAQILQPLTIGSHFVGQVFKLSADAPIAEAVTAMQANSFSQIPIYQDEAFVGLLTANTVARWLGANVTEDLVSLSETQIAVILAHTENQDHVRFIARDTTLAEIVEIFQAQELRGWRLEALLITQNGRRGERLLGIITVYDLVKINQLLAA
jgi:predicted transcriptional regulator